MTYADELANKLYVGNVVVFVYGQYFAIRQPDSGLTIPSPNSGMIQNLTINPTQVDLKRVNTTVGQYTFEVVDKDNVFTALFSNNTQITSVPVRIWIGRSKQIIDGVNFDFSSYFELPQTSIVNISHKDNSYAFTTAENTNKMTRPVFNTSIILGADMTTGSTVIQASGDISSFPSSGLMKIDLELISWSSLDLVNNRFNGCIRGIDSTVPAAHKLGATIYNVYKVEENPIDIFLKMIISQGGGGPYDVYPEGLGISAALIDVAGLETLRDSIFNLQVFRLYLYNIPSALTYLEQQILYPNNLRIAISADSKITLALLDQSVFGAPVPIIDETTINDYPDWEVDDTIIVNQIVIDWDWSEATAQYQQHSVFDDPVSQADFGIRQPINIQTKGIVADHDGATLVHDRANRLLLRLSTPSPMITVQTQIDKSLVNIGDKVLLNSSQVPTAFGSLNFSEELEVLSRTIDDINGICTFLLAFTSYAGIRSAYISPSDLIISVGSQSQVTVGAGRGSEYKPGWAMKLWDEAANAYVADAPRIIDSIAGDVITFTSPFTTTILATQHRIKFPLYDESVDDQHRYAYIDDNTLGVFPDGSGSYRITF